MVRHRLRTEVFGDFGGGVVRLIGEWRFISEEKGRQAKVGAGENRIHQESRNGDSSAKKKEDKPKSEPAKTESTKKADKK